MQGAFVGADVRPMTEPDATASAILWDQGRIIAVGGDRAIRTEARRRGIVVTELDGKAVLPGFVDAHMHFLHLGLRAMRPWLDTTRSRQEALAAVAQYARQHEGPVVAEAWDESAWDDTSFPTRQELDAIDATRPVVMRRIDGHTAVGNSVAVRALAARWPDAVDTESGLLLEEPSLYLNDVIPMPHAELGAAVEQATRAARAEGCTTIGAYERTPFRQTCIRAAKDDRLAIRLVLSIYAQQLDDEMAKGFRTGRLHGDPEGRPGRGPRLVDGGLKLFLDGSIGGRTAYLRAPYQDVASRGRRTYTPAELQALVSRAHAAGIQVHAHAIGDAAIDDGLDAFAKVGPSDLRHRFEHFELAHDEHLDTVARLGVVASVQPNFVGTWSKKGGLYHRALGDGYAINNRFRRFKQAGIRVAFGSDGMPFGPRVGLQAAVDHPDPAQRLSAEEAVWHYTHEAAWSLHMERWVGSLRPGLAADMVVLDRWSPAPREWQIQGTWIDGEP